MGPVFRNALDCCLDTHPPLGIEVAPPPLELSSLNQSPLRTVHGPWDFRHGFDRTGGLGTGRLAVRQSAPG